MAQKKVFIIGACIVVAGLGIGLILLQKHNDNIKPIDNKVGSHTTSSSSIPVGNSSSANGIQQAGGNQSSTAGSTSNDTQAEVTKMTDPTTFSQYNAAKYQNANQAFYANLQTGTGATLSKSGQKAVIVYRAWLTNGKLFDETKVNSKGQNEAFEFTYEANPEQVIPGMDEGVAGMKVGGIRLLIIPPAAGYGSTAHSTIPANSVLIFEVQLAEIQ